jgi:hypothetical protein
MTFATFLTAAIGYALIYAAAPSRTALRARTRASVRRLLVAGAAILVFSAVFGAIAFGPVLGPLVALAAAATVGSVLILAGPFVAAERGESRTESSADSSAGRADGGRGTGAERTA